MSAVETQGVARAVRVVFPVRVEFAGASLSIREFTANLSVGGIFLPTEHEVPPRTRGTLTFRLSRWDEPFTVDAEVVRVVAVGDAVAAGPPGLGIQFVDLSPADRARLERLVSGIQDGSIAQAIRRSIREDGRELLRELRRRPADQKVIFAVGAGTQEIDALIHDGNPAVLMRVLDNPRLGRAGMRTMLRDPRVPTKVLSAVLRLRRWLTDPELRALYCTHPHAPLDAARRLLSGLSRDRLVAIVRDGKLRPAIREKARQTLSGMNDRR